MLRKSSGREMSENSDLIQVWELTYFLSLRESPAPFGTGLMGNGGVRPAAERVGSPCGHLTVFTDSCLLGAGYR